MKTVISQGANTFFLCANLLNGFFLVIRMLFSLFRERPRLARRALRNTFLKSVEYTCDWRRVFSVFSVHFSRFSRSALMKSPPPGFLALVFLLPNIFSNHSFCNRSSGMSRQPRGGRQQTSDLPSGSRPTLILQRGFVGSCPCIAPRLRRRCTAEVAGASPPSSISCVPVSVPLSLRSRQNTTRLHASVCD